MTAMITIDRLSKRFGPIKAVDGVSFSVSRGEVLGFLGPNGAGKSTTMKMLTGFLPPDSGQALVCGYDVTTHPIEAKRRVGYMPEGAPAYLDMTPRAFLSFIADMRGFSGAEKRARIDRAADSTRIRDVMEQPIDTLSRGYKRRVGLAQALLHDPEVLVLDEPTDGLDPNQKHEVRELIKQMAPNKAIVISTHILEEVDAICSRAVIIARGRIVADGTPEALEALSPRHNGVFLRVTSPAAAGEMAALLRRSASVAEVEIAGDTVFAYARDGRDMFDEVRALVRSRNIDVPEMHVERGKLEDVFRMVTTGNAPVGDAAARAA